MDRVNPLLCSIYSKDPGKFIGNLMKQNGIYLIVYGNLLHVSQGLRAYLGGFTTGFGNIKGKMSLNVECYLGHCFFIEEVMYLLDN